MRLALFVALAAGAFRGAAACTGTGPSAASYAEIASIDCTGATAEGAVCPTVVANPGYLPSEVKCVSGTYQVTLGANIRCSAARVGVNLAAYETSMYSIDCTKDENGVTRQAKVSLNEQCFVTAAPGYTTGTVTCDTHPSDSSVQYLEAVAGTLAPCAATAAAYSGPLHWSMTAVDCSKDSSGNSQGSPISTCLVTPAQGYTTGTVTCTGGELVTVGGTLNGFVLSPTPNVVKPPTTPSPTSAGGVHISERDDQEAEFIKYLHSFYHYETNEFDLDNQSYIAAILAFGVITAAIGLCLLVSYFTFLGCRAGCDCCRRDAICGPSFSRCLLLLLMFICVGCTAVSFQGWLNFSNGVKVVVNSVDNVQMQFETLSLYGEDLSANANTLTSSAAKFVCDDASNTDDGETKFIQAASMFDRATDKFQDAVGGAIKVKLDALKPAFEDQLYLWVTAGLGGVLGLVIIYTFFGFCGVCCKSAILLNLASCLGIITMIVLTLLVAVEVSFSVLLADMCFYGPASAAVESASLVAGVAGTAPMPTNVALYYTTCDVAGGSVNNPLDAYLNGTKTALATLDQLQTSAEASCSLEWAPLSDREALLSDMHMASVQANRTLGKIDDAMQCDNLYDQWAVIENAMCNELVTGLWQLWAVHAVAAVFLYLALYLTSYVKQKCKVLKLLDEEGTVRAVPLGPPLAPAMTV